ncbi:hypothetical protein VP01_1056g2 [Puccinia sorghi]|uniref:Uncharacterized protein n=1 Tax=Puccinia sorghi TaxID=27349 RepID=A0A0L6VUA1_9BASI|nr:hypothetical protein VP01_1056g2 [Puccinia sorghi]
MERRWTDSVLRCEQYKIYQSEFCWLKKGKSATTNIYRQLDPCMRGSGFLPKISSLLLYNLFSFPSQFLMTAKKKTPLSLEAQASLDFFFGEAREIPLHNRALDELLIFRRFMYGDFYCQNFSRDSRSGRGAGGWWQEQAQEQEQGTGTGDINRNRDRLVLVCFSLRVENYTRSGFLEVGKIHSFLTLNKSGTQHNYTTSHIKRKFQRKICKIKCSFTIEAFWTGLLSLRLKVPHPPSNLELLLEFHSSISSLSSLLSPSHITLFLTVLINLVWKHEISSQPIISGREIQIAHWILPAETVREYYEGFNLSKSCTLGPIRYRKSIIRNQSIIKKIIASLMAPKICLIGLGHWFWNEFCILFLSSGCQLSYLWVFLFWSLKIMCFILHHLNIRVRHSIIIVSETLRVPPFPFLSSATTTPH